MIGNLLLGKGLILISSTMMILTPPLLLYPSCNSGVMFQRLVGVRLEWLRLLKRKEKCGLLLGLFAVERYFAPWRRTYLYRKLAEEKSGCYWELFEVYRHLKSLGYIIGHRGVPWSMKSVMGNCKGTTQNNEVVDIELFGTTSLVQMFGHLQIDELRPDYDVYPPNSKFRKSFPGDPMFLLCPIRWLILAEEAHHPAWKVQLSRDNVVGFL